MTKIEKNKIIQYINSQLFSNNHQITLILLAIADPHILSARTASY